MEPLWSPGVATGGNQRQIGWLSEPQKQANSVATTCRQLRREVHGKQGVCRGLPPVAEGPLPANRGGRPVLLRRALSLVAAVRAWALIATAAGARLADHAESVWLLAGAGCGQIADARIGKVMRSTLRQSMSRSRLWGAQIRFRLAVQAWVNSV